MSWFRTGVANGKFKRYMSLSESNCIIGQKGNERAQIALSSLIHALLQKKLYALARLVTKDGRPPVMVMLAPCIEVNIECLIDVQVVSPLSEFNSRFRSQKMFDIILLHRWTKLSR
jgi:hypothetical protein